MPGRDGFGEVSSASHCTDYQSRRLNTRYKDTVKKSNQFVHTLNATGVAIPRAMVRVNSFIVYIGPLIAFHILPVDLFGCCL